LLVNVHFFFLFLYCVFGVPLWDVCSFRFPFYGASSSVSRKVANPLLLLGARFYVPVQTGAVAHIASCTIVVSLFSGGKAA
jgi:hypothetical protein